MLRDTDRNGRKVVRFVPRPANLSAETRRDRYVQREVEVEQDLWSVVRYTLRIAGYGLVGAVVASTIVRLLFAFF